MFWNIRNILAILLLLGLILFIVGQYSGFIKVGNSEVQPPSTTTSTSTNMESIQKKTPDSAISSGFTWNRYWIYQHRIAIGIGLVIIMIIGSIILTKRFFDNID